MAGRFGAGRHLVIGHRGLRRRLAVAGAGAALFLAAGLTVVAPASAAGSTPVCQPGSPAPTDGFPGNTVVADGFESGTLDNWTVHTGGDGTANVQSAPAPVYDGGCAARLVTTTAPGSLANASVAIPAGSGEVYTDGWFNLSIAGATGDTNPYFRFFSGSTRIASVYRYAGNGQLWLEVLNSAGSYVHTKLTSRSISMNAWHHVQMAIAPNGTSTTVSVWLDGTLMFSSSGVNGPATPVTSVMLGNEHNSQAGDLSIDDVIVKADPPPQSVCTNPYTPTDSMPGQVVVADGFECGTLSNWAVHQTGDGTATVQTSPVYDGAYAACLHTSDVSPSLANLTKALPAGTTQASTDGWFDMTTAGPDGNDQPYFRFFSGTTRIVDTYRYNSTGQPWLRVLQPNGTFAYTRLSTAAIPLNTWHRVQMSVVAAGSASTVQVWLDGAQVYNGTVDLPAQAITSMMLGAEHYPQPGDECFDDVIVKAGS